MLHDLWFRIRSLLWSARAERDLADGPRGCSQPSESTRRGHGGIQRSASH